jgi:hypothetical protein
VYCATNSPAGTWIFTMLSTRHALKEWDSVRELLADIQACAAVHPSQSLPTNLNARSQRVRHSMAAFSRALASPSATWQQLLEKEVSFLLWWCIGGCVLSRCAVQSVCCLKPAWHQADDPYQQGQYQSWLLELSHCDGPGTSRTRNGFYQFDAQCTSLVMACSFVPQAP